MGGQGLCSVTADQNKILIITSQATKHAFFTARVFWLKISKLIQKIKKHHYWVPLLLGTLF